jgi:hypothetical protein
MLLAAIAAARAVVWARAWKLADGHAPDAGVNPARPLIVDVDATPVIAHSGTRATNGPGLGEPPPNVRNCRAQDVEIVSR